MNTLPKSTPSSVRSGSSPLRPIIFGPPIYRARGTEARPHLISIQPRRAGAPQQRVLPLFPHESEDARLTGSTRSLYRRLLALNLRSDAQNTQATQEKVLTVRKFQPSRETSPLASRLA